MSRCVQKRIQAMTNRRTHQLIPGALTFLLPALLVACSDLDDQASSDVDVSYVLSGTVTASSSRSATANQPSATKDGNTTSTRWESQWLSNDEWLKFDLGSAQSIGQVKIFWESAYASAYTIETSNDNTTWTT